MENQITLTFEQNFEESTWDSSIFDTYIGHLYYNKTQIGYIKIVLIPHEKKVFSTYKNYTNLWPHKYRLTREHYQCEKKFFHKKGLVAYSSIEKEFQGKGYGSLMYQLVNKEVQKMGYIIGSDTTRSQAANNLWNKLIVKNLAYLEKNRYYLK